MFFPTFRKGKNRTNPDIFPKREKVGKIPIFSQGRKILPLTGGKSKVSLTVNGGRKAGLSAARRPPFP